jgi:endonuclease/exonuclease/phosphatase family metal-dependent hydrolase
MRAAPIVLPLAAVGLTLVLGAVLPRAAERALNYTDPAGPLYTTAHGHRPGGAAGPDVVRIVSFNIQFALEVDRAIEVLRTTPALRGCDLLLLQEMDGPGTERIARALGLNSAFVPGSVHPRYGRDFGNAVLSPWPIEAARKLLLPHESRAIAQRRSAVAATVDVGGRRVRAYSVHVETMLRMSARSRRDQLQAVLDDASAWPGPVVIAGDLNGSDLAKTVEDAGYLRLTRDVHGTMRGWAARWVDFDHVFVRGFGLVAPGGAGVEDERGASDHRPVWALARFDP